MSKIAKPQPTPMPICANHQARVSRQIIQERLNNASPVAHE
jgi:hypothetical protein